MKIELITIGDEILLGNSVDTNSHWIAEQLTNNGMRLTYHQTVGDNSADIQEALRIAYSRSESILVTGGLGPTHDDITIEEIARFHKDKLVLNSSIRDGIAERFTARGITPSPGYEKMAYLPSHAEPIGNSYGSAPGVFYRTGSVRLFCMPGVPKEMKGMFSETILPMLISLRLDFFQSRIYRTAGVGESLLAQKIGTIDDLLPCTLAFLPSIDDGVILRLSCGGKDEEFTNLALNRAEDRLINTIGDYIYTYGMKRLEEVILDRMRERGLRLVLAESCTGGKVCDRLVAISGCSDVLDRGFVTYSNHSKVEQLKVSPDIINSFGAVSAECVVAMAKGARKVSGADIAISVTGIAGPGGGSEQKPVGTVYVGLADKEGGLARLYHFTGDRDGIRRRAGHTALTLLWHYLDGRLKSE